MKKNLVRLATVFAVLGGVFAQGRLWAQPLSADVPFAFRAGDTLLPAGKYLIKAELSKNMILIRGPERGSTIFVRSIAAERVNALESGKLVFHRYGEQYFLWQVWSPGYRQGRELPKSTAEKEMARAAGAEVATLRASSR